MLALGYNEYGEFRDACFEGEWLIDALQLFKLEIWATLSLASWP